MKAADLLKESEYKWILGPKDREFDEIVLDSRKVTEKTAFIAMIGQKTDGHRHIEDAAGKGAALILVADEKDKFNPHGICYIQDDHGQKSCLLDQKIRMLYGD